MSDKKPRPLIRITKHADPLAKAALYRLRHDTLLIVSKLNSNRNTSNEDMKRQMVFVQSQLCKAAIADASVPTATKKALMEFQAATMAENIQDRRGSLRRRPEQKGAA
ncbi:MAG: hypothetical protein C0631_18965 [Sedimenticola sp.]|nr:MAG: hypothetical protein C0631_18965 [Sedimenticola sp.]